MGFTRRTCRVVSCRDVTSQVEFGLYCVCVCSAAFHSRESQENHRQGCFMVSHNTIFIISISQYQYLFSARIFVVRRNERRDERTDVTCPCDGGSEMSWDEIYKQVMCCTGVYRVSARSKVIVRLSHLSICVEFRSFIHSWNERVSQSVTFGSGLSDQDYCKVQWRASDHRKFSASARTSRRKMLKRYYRMDVWNFLRSVYYNVHCNIGCDGNSNTTMY